MSGATLPCAQCGTPVIAVPDTEHAEYTCATCGTRQQVWLFPAAARPLPAGRHGQPRADAALASCQFHEHLLAEASCAACGIFLCGGCAVSFDGHSYCTECLEAAQRMRTAPKLTFQYNRWDVAALGMALLPWVLFPLAGIVTLALMSLFPGEADERFIPMAFAGGMGVVFLLICGPASLFLGLYFRKWRFSALGVRARVMMLARIAAVLEVLAILGVALFVIYQIAMGAFV